MFGQDKPQQWAFTHGAIDPLALDLWDGCNLALPFWDYGGRLCEDVSGNGLHAEFQAGIDPAADWDIGPYGAFLDLEGGTNEDLLIPVPPAAWLDGTSKLSVEVIFRVDNVTGIKGLVGKYTTTNGRRSWRLYVNGDEVELQVSSDGNGNEIQTTTNANLGTGTSYHFVATFDGGVFKAYKDGVALTTDGDFSTHTSIFAGTLENIRIANRSDTNRLVGGIAGIRVWRGRALTADEVSRLYHDPWEMYRPHLPAPWLPSLALEHSGGAAAGPWIKAADVAAGLEAYLIEGLTNGVAYDVQLRTVDTSGNISTGSTPVSETPAAGATATTLRSVYLPRFVRSQAPAALLARLSGRRL